MPDDISPDTELTDEMQSELSQSQELHPGEPLRIADLEAIELSATESLEISAQYSERALSFTPELVSQIEPELNNLIAETGGQPSMAQIDSLLNDLIEQDALNLSPELVGDLVLQLDGLNNLKNEIGPEYQEKWGEELTLGDLYAAQQLGHDLLKIGPENLQSSIDARNEWLEQTADIISNTLNIEPSDALVINQHGADLVNAAQSFVANEENAALLSDTQQRPQLIMEYADASGLSYAAAEHIIGTAEELRDMGPSFDFKPLFGEPPLPPEVSAQAEALETSALQSSLMLNLDLKTVSARIAMGTQADDIGAEVLTPTQRAHYHLEPELEIIDALGVSGLSENIKTHLALELNAEKGNFIQAELARQKQEELTAQAAMQHAANKGLDLSAQPKATETLQTPTATPEKESLGAIVRKAISKTVAETAETVEGVIGADKNIFQRAGNAIELAGASTVGLVGKALTNFGNFLSARKAA